MGQRNELRARPKYTGRAPRRCLALLSVSCALLMGAGSAAAATPEPAGGALRDGQHDFDFNFGVWKTHIKRIVDPFSGSAASQELNGTVTVRKVWGGRALLEEIEADGPKGHWEGLTLFLYNPTAHQWTQSFAGSRVGMISSALVGEFRNGRGELFQSDTLQGRAILVRGVWSDIKPNSHRYEEDYSADGGATWAPAFIAELTREAAP
jgi:hypothetical protein